MNQVKIFTVFILLTALVANLIWTKHSTAYETNSMSESEFIHSSPSIQMYFYIKQYAEQYKIPESYAFAVAFQETGYKGPLDLNYDHKQTSKSGALGPMQIMPATARYIEGRDIQHSDLKSNIRLNVEISMKLLRKLKDQYGTWGLAFGAYNTGKPIVNQYAENVLKKQYFWVEI